MTTENQTPTEPNRAAEAGQLDCRVMQEQIGEVLTSLVASSDKALLELSEVELYGQWLWQWDDNCSIEWNTYKFSDMLEIHKRRCRRWEEQHNGNCCVVERVRDKYLMPRVREFVDKLLTHNAELTRPAPSQAVPRRLMARVE